jgi:hypothetical protein
VPYANAGSGIMGACCGCSSGPCTGGTSGICGSSVSDNECVAYGGIFQGQYTLCDPDPCGCVATVKCVCESKFSGAIRVVPCPAGSVTPPI